MTGTRDIAEHVLDLLGPSSGVDLAPFFGGWSLRREGKQIGIVMDTAYAKVDLAHRDAWHAAGSTPFRYTARGRTVTVEAYWSIPADALDDPDLLRDLLLRTSHDSSMQPDPTLGARETSTDLVRVRGWRRGSG